MEGVGSRRSPPRKRKTAPYAIIVSVTRRAPGGGFALRSTKFPFLGDTRQRRVARLQNRSKDDYRTTMASPGNISRGGVRPFADNASGLVPGKIVVAMATLVTSVCAIHPPADGQVDVCAGIAENREVGCREEVEVPTKTFHRVDVSPIRLYAAFHAVSSDCFWRLKTQPFSDEINFVILSRAHVEN